MSNVSHKFEVKVDGEQFIAYCCAITAAKLVMMVGCLGSCRAQDVPKVSGVTVTAASLEG